MAIRAKSTSVNFDDYSLAICHILSALAKIHAKGTVGQPINLIITSANDGQHKPDSKHYKNQAIDLRSKSFKDEQAKFDFMTALSKELGPKFSILYEYPGQLNEHFHIQVKKGESWP